MHKKKWLVRINGQHIGYVEERDAFSAGILARKIYGNVAKIVCELKILPEELNEEDTKIIKSLNAEISKRKYYGIREETAPAPGYIIGWSNADAIWHIYSGYRRKGEKLRLDANLVFASYSRDKLERVTPYLNQLPLYVYSTEAKERGEPYTSLDWAIKQIESRIIVEKDEEKKVKLYEDLEKLESLKHSLISGKPFYFSHGD